MPWGNRPSSDDWPHENHYGWTKCPRCGRAVKNNGFGFTSHIRSCIRKSLVVDGKTFPPIRGKVVIGNAVFEDPYEKES
jgi:hypothetical protein